MEERTARGRLQTAGRPAITERLERALAEITAADGFDAVNPRAIALRAGTSIRPAYDRYLDRTDLALALWGSLGDRAVTTLVEPLVDALCDGKAAAASRAVARIYAHPLERSCLRELILVAAFDEEIRSRLTERFRSRDLGDDELVRTKRTVARAVAIGLITGVKDLVGEHQLDDRLAEVASALTNVGPIAELPATEATFMRLQPIVTGDSLADAALNATLHEVAEFGYRATTMDRICDRAELSEGAVFARYASKLDLLIDIVERRLREAMAVTAAFTADLTVAIGPARTEALMWREFFRPEHRLACCFAMEINRVALHAPRLASRIEAARMMFASDYLETLDLLPRMAAEGSIAFGLTLGDGLQTLAVLYPEGFELPFSAITANLNG